MYILYTFHLWQRYLWGDSLPCTVYTFHLWQRYLCRYSLSCIVYIFYLWQRYLWRDFLLYIVYSFHLWQRYIWRNSISNIVYTFPRAKSAKLCRHESDWIHGAGKKFVNTFSFFSFSVSFSFPFFFSCLLSSFFSSCKFYSNALSIYHNPLLLECLFPQGVLLLPQSSHHSRIHQGQHFPTH